MNIKNYWPPKHPSTFMDYIPKLNKKFDLSYTKILRAFQIKILSSFRLFRNQNSFKFLCSFLNSFRTFSTNELRNRANFSS